MAKSMNQVTLLGNVGRDPEVRYTQAGTAVANLSLATNDYAGKDSGGNVKEVTNWHRVTVWGKLAEVVERYVRQGDRILVTGEIRYSTYEKNGETRYSTDIIAKDVVLLGGRQEEEEAPVARPKKAAAPVGVPDDDLPF